MNEVNLSMYKTWVIPAREMVDFNDRKKKVW